MNNKENTFTDGCFSFAMFMLAGGAILLMMLIAFIAQMIEWITTGNHPFTLH